MDMQRRRFVAGSASVGTAAFAATAGFPGHALAQTKYPDRPLRLVVPFAPGGETDFVGRTWANRVSPHLGVTVVVDNRPGAGGAVGAAEAARAKADGYTLLSGTTTTHVINPAAMDKPSYDPQRDFAPVTLVSASPTCIMVNPSLPAKNLKELVAFIKTHQKRLSYGSPGAGSINHLAGELFKQMIGAPDLQHIPYRGAGPGVADLIAGHVPLFMGIFGAQPLAQHRAGRVRILAVFSDVRLKAAPELPTAVEQGLTGMVTSIFHGVFVPAGTAQPLIAQLHGATQKAWAEGLLQKDLETVGGTPAVDSTPESAARFIRDEVARWTPLVKSIGLKIE
jgi:tripartite-type tricarboxylate transporter receptor subunit TctC